MHGKFIFTFAGVRTRVNKYLMIFFSLVLTFFLLLRSFIFFLFRVLEYCTRFTIFVSSSCVAHNEAIFHASCVQLLHRQTASAWFWCHDLPLNRILVLTNNTVRGNLYSLFFVPAIIIKYPVYYYRLS